MPPTLITYGDLIVDVIVKTDSFPLPGQDSIASHAMLRPGGSASNCAIVASRLSLPVEFLGVTGQDSLSGMLVDNLRKFGVGVGHVRQTDGPTALVISLVGPSGERSFLSFRGVNESGLYGPIAPNLIQTGDCLHISGYSFQGANSRSTAIALIKQARMQGAIISLDPSFYFSQEFGPRPYEVLSDLDVIFPNLDEARLLSGAQDPAEAAAIIRALGPQTVVIKMGKDGCFVDSGRIKMQVAPTYSGPVVDTTGAGDAFCGAYLSAMLWGIDAVQSARIANAVAACIIRGENGIIGAPTIPELIAARLLDPPISYRLERIYRESMAQHE